MSMTDIPKYFAEAAEKRDAELTRKVEESKNLEALRHAEQADKCNCLTDPVAYQMCLQEGRDILQGDIPTALKVASKLEPFGECCLASCLGLWGEFYWGIPPMGSSAIGIAAIEKGFFVGHKKGDCSYWVGARPSLTNALFTAARGKLSPWSYSPTNNRNFLYKWGWNVDFRHRKREINQLQKAIDERNLKDGETLASQLADSLIMEGRAK